MRSLLRTVTAGQVDAGFASLATFVMGIFAVRVFDAATLGVYALFFAAFLFATEFPRQLIFVPSEIWVLEFERAGRVGLMRHSLGTGAMVALPAAVIVTVAVLPLVGDVDAGTLTALAVSSSITAFVSPLQDHVRRLLHLSGSSWLAALVSSVQFGGMVGGLLLIRNVGNAWAPFGALALANVLSTGTGLVTSRFLTAEGIRPSKRDLVSIGRWLLVVGLASSGAGLIASALVESLAGTAALGYVEGARVVARPLQVFGVGLLAVLGPRSMEAAAASDLPTARRIRRVFVLASLVIGIPYAFVVAFEWSWNPLVDLLPNAYVVGGLLLLTILGNLVYNLLVPYRAEILGAQRQVALAKVEISTNGVQTVVAAGAGVLGAYALPVGALIGAFIRWPAFRRVTRKIYSRVPDGPSTVAFTAETPFFVKNGGPASPPRVPGTVLRLSEWKGYSASITFWATFSPLMNASSVQW